MDTLRIGDLELKYRTGLAPMASLTDIVFRRAVDEIGDIGFMVTELISAEGLRRRQKRTLSMIRTFPYKTPQFIQLFGYESDSFSEAAELIKNETDFSGIDINMGCPARKVVKKRAGSALLRDPEQVKKICRAVREKSDLPLTVKIRLGYDKVNFEEILKVLEGEGVDAVTIHFRLKADNYNNPARWEYSRGLKGNFMIPIFGNGDIEDAAIAKKRLKTVDGILIGRGAIKNPFIFSEIKGEKISGKEREDIALRILALIEEYYPEKLRLARIKAFTKYLVTGRPGAKSIRKEIYSSESFKDTKKLFPSMWKKI